MERYHTTESSSTVTAATALAYVGALSRLGYLRAASGGILHRVGDTKSNSSLHIYSRHGNVARAGGLCGLHNE